MLGHYYMPTLCYNAGMKISVYEYFIIRTLLISYTQNNEFVLNALLECIKFLLYTLIQKIMPCSTHIEVTVLLDHIDGHLKYECLLHGCLWPFA